MEELPIRIDYSLAMAPGLDAARAPDDAALDAFGPRFSAAHDALLEAVDAGELGFFGLPWETNTAEEAVRFAASVPDSITDVLVLGIGGSSLGARAVYQALVGPPELVVPKSSGRRLHFPDNSDPWLLSRLLEALDPAHTLAVVISKSGGTVETAAQLLIVDRWLGARRATQLVAITDPSSGSLRAMADADGLTSFAIPSNVGGRYCILSAAGLVPAALAGIDVHGLLEGAQRMADACRRPGLRENPAGLIAAIHVLHHERYDRGIHVMMPYADALRPFAAWYVQLWAESLGKRLDRSGRRVERGPTPLSAVGATDQHSQVQLFIEGPRDKLITFISLDEHERDLEIPAAQGANSYLGGVRLSALLEAERRGTALALAEDGRPSLHLTLPRLDAQGVGALLFLYEAATALAGGLYDIDPFDQPGVEEGKRLAFGLLGREGYEEFAETVRQREEACSKTHRLG